jgi:predicted SnoaL-like aldol condensation-catalyzing enzyme
MPTTDEIKQAARDFFQRVLNEGDLEYADSLISDDLVEHNPLGPDLTHDKAGAMETFRRLHANSSDLKTEILDLVASGNRVAIRSRMTGTDDGPGWAAPMGAPATGKSFSIEAIDVAIMNDEGKWSEHYGLVDVGSMMMQLGLMPPPPDQEG